MAQRICSIQHCGRPLIARGLCGAHYKRLRDGQPLDTPVRHRGESRDCCTIPGCGKRHHCRGLCAMHLDRLRHGRPLDSEPMILGVVIFKCQNCGTDVIKTSPNHRFCEPCGADSLRVSYRVRASNRRARLAAAGRVKYTLAEIISRDGKRCHLCGRRIDFDLPSTHGMSWTFDHLIPIALGGSDIPSNVGLAHSRCNKSKGARWSDQQHLF